MAKTPVPGPDGERCFQDSTCAHADPRSEFAYEKPVLTPVTTRKNADASPQRATIPYDGSKDGRLTS